MARLEVEVHERARVVGGALTGASVALWLRAG